MDWDPKVPQGGKFVPWVQEGNLLPQVVRFRKDPLGSGSGRNEREVGKSQIGRAVKLVDCHLDGQTF